MLRERDDLAFPFEDAFAPQPIILPVSDILFDAWALTTIRSKLPGRPLVEPYLHGLSAWEPPEMHVAWREEVEVLRLKFESEPERWERETEERNRLAKFAAELLEDYPLKPHELLRDRATGRSSILNRSPNEDPKNRFGCLTTTASWKSSHSWNSPTRKRRIVSRERRYCSRRRLAVLKTEC